MRQEQCPVCGTGIKEETSNLSLVLCGNCGVSWTLINSEIDAEALYEDEVYAVVDNRKSIFERIIFGEANNVVQTVNKLIQWDLKLHCLDFGSGKGQFLHQAQEAGWKVLGIETAKERAGFAREKYGVEVIGDQYKSGIVGEGNFDVISLFHVLEHLPQPLSLLQELVQKNLRAGGILVIEVPNLDSWQHAIAGGKWLHLDIPKHLSHWNEKLLVEKVETLGFQKVKSQYFSLHLGVLGSLSALLGKLGYRGNIIYDLKNRKSIPLLLGVAIVLPISLFMEIFALPFRKTGILRLYFKKYGS
ncbi:class I SAM-dependent methyltransferase [Cecembia sp.]|uniref:class I SAM-dependent methyltransferase n=1 Tax=Cecembia sp. TaxID=1898110 RepID=UPI0025BFAA27|nr:class I SAM-dependent methyltransferase [Cecembia sp.]